MNKIYKVIWSRAKHCYIVASEIAKSSGKSSSSNKAKKTEAKGGIMDNAVIDVSVIKKLSELPTKDVLLTKILWSLKGSVRNLACALNAVKEQKEA